MVKAKLSSAVFVTVVKRIVSIEHRVTKTEQSLFLTSLQCHIALLLPKTNINIKLCIESMGEPRKAGKKGRCAWDNCAASTGRQARTNIIQTRVRVSHSHSLTFPVSVH